MGTYQRTTDYVFSKYKDKGIIERSSARFLFVIAFIFFILMFMTFIFFLGRVSLVKLMVSCVSSLISSLVTMLLIRQGKFRIAASFFVIFQCFILLAGAGARSPETNMVTVLYFIYPTLVLAAMFTPRSVQLFTVAAMIGLLIWNSIRGSIAPADTVSWNYQLIREGTIMSIISVIMTYSIIYFVMKFLKIAIRASENEAKITADKNEYILHLIETIKSSYNEINGSIRLSEGVINEIFYHTQSGAATIEEISASMEEISANTANVDTAAIDQTSSVDNLGECIQSLNSLMNNLQDFGMDLRDAFKSIISTSQNGKRSSQAISDINRKILVSSVNIQGIADVIDDFFDRINLLALNASIEAARAGEHGRGFAVVADEVSKLADNSSGELSKIKELITTNRRDMESASSIIDEIVVYIEKTVESISDAGIKSEKTLEAISQQKLVQKDMLEKNSIVHEKSIIIQGASQEQSTAISEIVLSIESTSSLMQGIADNSQVLKADYEKLKKLSEDLNVILMSDNNTAGINKRNSLVQGASV